MVDDNEIHEEPDADSAAEREWDAPEQSEDPSALAAVRELPSLEDGDYLYLLPGGEFEIARALSKPRKLPKAVVYHAGNLILCEGKRRSVVRTLRNSMDNDDSGIPLATRLVLVVIDQRVTPPRSRGRRYLIATNEDEELLGWIDHSPPGWEFPTSAVRLLAKLTAIECVTERFDIETAFDTAHPRWVT